MFKNCRLLIWFLVLPWATIPVQGQILDVDEKYLELFGPEEPLRVTFRFHLDSLIKDIGEDNRKHDGFMTWQHLPEVSKSIEVQAETRGNFRRKEKYCSFPPLAISIKKKEREGTVFSKYKNLDLVTHCQPKEDYYQYVLKEYIAFRIYNLFTEFSYKVRLLEVEYQDMDGTSIGIFPGIFIEEDDELKDRMPGDDIKTEVARLYPDRFAPSFTFSLFQFMIGNTDWNLEYEHNVKLFTHEITGDTLTVPYDFDHSGLVNAEYATAYRVYQLESPRERLWIGECFEEEEFRKELARIMDLRNEVRDIVRNTPGISRDTERDAWQFLNDFFRDFNDPVFAGSVIRSSCGVYH